MHGDVRMFPFMSPEMIHALFGCLQRLAGEDAQIKERRAEDRTAECQPSDPANIPARVAMEQERGRTGKLSQSFKEGGASCGSEANEVFGFGPSSNTM